MKQLFSCAVLIALMLITAGYATADLAEGLVVYFTFDNVKGKTIVDDSGNTGLTRTLSLIPKL